MAKKQTNTDALPAGEETPKLKDAEDLAIDALSQTSQAEGEGLSEKEKSDQFAQTLHSLENVIESKAKKLMQLKDKMKKKRQMISNVFENDQEYQEVEEQKTEVYQEWKQRKNTLNETVQVRQLKEDLRDLKNDQKDLEASLSNHLINYHQLTNSTSFDTSDGDQWEFKIKAKVKTKKLKK